MAVVTFARPPRSSPPPPPDGDVQIQPPPMAPPQRLERPAWWLVLPAVIAVLAALALLITAQGGSALRLTAGLLFALCTLVLVGWYGWVLGAGRGRRIAARRTAYLRHLAEVRGRARRAAAAQRAAELWLHPPPQALASLIRTSRLWERRPDDADFGSVRIGVGDRPLSVGLYPIATPPRVGPQQLDPVSANLLRRLLRAHRTVPSLPVVLPLRSLARVTLQGDPGACRAMATALLLQAVSWHAPAELRVALCVDDAGLVAWDWLKWVPHLADPSVPPTDLPRFVVAADLPAVEGLLGDDLAGRPWADASCLGLGHILVIVDGGGSGGRRLADADGVHGVTVLDVQGHLDGPMTNRRLRLRVTADDLLAVTVDAAGREEVAHLGTPDLVGRAEAAAAARGLAAVRLVDQDADHPRWPPTSLAEVIGVTDPRSLNTATLWRPRPGRDRLRVAIGVDVTGQAVDIDLKAAADGGLGPHGLVAGTTGSGKSELLRTVVLGLAITHSSDNLNFLLVDVLNRGSFTALQGLPHTSAVIDGLTEPGLVNRLVSALQGEIERRREVIGRPPAGQLAEPPAGAAPALPDLLVVLDDCGELFTGHPERCRQLTEIGLAGTTLGIHLLLSVSDPGAGVLGELADLLTYRVALRTATVEQSRLIIGTGGAGHLPHRPGVGYLAAGADQLIRFTAAWVSGPLRVQSASTGRHGWVDPQAFRLTTAIAEPDAADPAAPGAAVDPPGGRRRALIDVAVGQLAGSGIPAHEVWLPPLDQPPSLDLLLPRVAVQAPDPGRLGSGTAAAGAAYLQAPLGWVDRPVNQSRELLTIDLSGSAGVVAITGAPGSGKSTALRSLICALALSHPPDQVQVYCLDFGDGALLSLFGLPHVGAVADRTEPERIRRLIAMLTSVMLGRENTRPATTANPGGPGSLRPDDGFGDIVVVVDGWDSLTKTVPTAETGLISLAARGRPHGIHLVLSADQPPAAAQRGGRPDRHPDRAATERPGPVPDRPDAGRAGPPGTARPRARRHPTAPAHRPAAHRRARQHRRAGPGHHGNGRDGCRPLARTWGGTGQTAAGRGRACGPPRPSRPGAGLSRRSR